MGKNRQAFRDQLRGLIEKSGQTQYAICKATGIEPATLNRFMNAKKGAGLSMENLDRLAAHLGWTITADDAPNRKPRN